MLRLYRSKNDLIRSYHTLSVTKGVSLIEVMMVLVIFGFLMGLAAPTFNEFQTRRRTTLAAETLQLGLRMARSEAVRLQQPVGLTLTPGVQYSYVVNCVAAGCNGNAPPNLPRAEFFAPNQVQMGASVALASVADAAAFAAALAPGAGLGAPNTVQFDSVGRATGAVRIDVFSAARRLSVVVSPGGAIRICDPALDGSAGAATATMGCA